MVTGKTTKAIPFQEAEGEGERERKGPEGAGMESLYLFAK